MDYKEKFEAVATFTKHIENFMKEDERAPFCMRIVADDIDTYKVIYIRFEKSAPSLKDIAALFDKPVILDYLEDGYNSYKYTLNLNGIQFIEYCEDLL